MGWFIWGLFIADIFIYMDCLLRKQPGGNDRRTSEAKQNHTRVHYITHTKTQTNMHTLKVSVVEIVEAIFVVVSIKVTQQDAAQRILAGRTNINPLTEETRTIISLPVSVAQV
jgi:hypothetical protein